MAIAVEFPAVSASCEAGETARRRREDRQTARSRDREEASSLCAPYGFIGAVTVVVAVARRAQLGSSPLASFDARTRLWKD